MKDFIKKNKMQILVSNIQQEEDHFHQDIELLYVLEGKMELTIYEKIYSLASEDLIIINSNERHSFKSSKDILFAKVVIAYNFVSRVYNGITSVFQCNSTNRETENYQGLRTLLKQMLTNQLSLNQDTDKGIYIDFEYISQYFNLLKLLTEYFLLNSGNKQKGTIIKSEQRMMQIRDFINENYAQPISLQSLSQHLYLSEGYLSRYFKQNYGMNFTEYLKQVRLSHTMDELLYTDKPITKIAYDNGFSSLAFFNRIFKKEYGKTPSSLRMKTAVHKKETIENSDDLIVHDRLEQFLHDNNQKYKQVKKSGDKKERYSVKEYKAAAPIWNQIINIGSASDLLKNEIQEHLFVLKQALDFQYVRFWNIFSKDLLIDINNKDGKYNFVKLDQVFDYILSIGLKPFIDLEEKITRINESTQSTILFTENIIEFENIHQWKMLLKAFIKHNLKRYGMDELVKWKVEVWFGGYCIKGMEELDSYFAIFNNTFDIIKHYVPELEVGGSGIFPEFVKEAEYRRINFWKEWVHKAKQPDFVSIINYAYEEDIIRGDRYGRRSSDREYLLNSIKKLKNTLNLAGIETVKLYVTEWNLTVSDRNFITDSCYQGAYIIKNIIDVYDQVDMIGYFTGSDRTSEYYDSNELLHGGKGLLSKDGIFKPSAFAVDFLNHLYPYFIVKRDNFLITTNLRNNYGIICHNLKKLSYYYYMSDEEKIDKDKIWKCFEDRSVLELDIRLEDVENGEYHIKTQRINDKSGSVLDIWSELDFHSELSRDDIKYFRRVCEPRLLIKTCVVNNHKIELKTQLEANEIAFIHIEKSL